MKQSLISVIVIIAVFVGYSVGCLFDSSGRLYQVEYANNAAKNGGTSISLKSDEYVVHVTYASQQTSLALSLHSSTTPLKVRRLNDYLAISTTGIVSDANHIINRAFEEIVTEKTRFGMSVQPSPLRLAHTLALHFGEKTLTSYHRPFGVSVCLLGYDSTAPSRAKACIYEIDPVGNLHKCRLCCLGRYSTELADTFPSDYFQQGSSIEVSDMVKRSVEAIVTRIKEEEEVDVDVDSDICVYIVGKHTPFCQLDKEMVARAYASKDYSFLAVSLGVNPQPEIETEKVI